MVAFLPDDPSYSPGEGEEGVILYAPFIRGVGDTYIYRNRQQNAIELSGRRQKKGIYLVILTERVGGPIIPDDVFLNIGNNSLS